MNDSRMGGASELYPADFGYGLSIVFGVWALVLLIMYPFCLWYSGLKQGRYDWWLSYL